MNWLDLVKALAPAILAVIPQTALFAPILIHGITEAEQLGGAGANKKAHVLALVQDGVLALNTAKGSTVIAPAAADAIASSAIDTTVNVVNLVHQAQTDALKG